MIPIQLWRARIGLFNAKCCCGGPPRSSFSSQRSTPSSCSSSLFELLQSHSLTIRDSPPGPSIHKHVPSSDHDCAFAGFSSENSSSTPHKQSLAAIAHTGKQFSARLRSRTVHSLLSSLPTDRLYLPSDLLKDALVMLLIAIISQLLVLSGDIEKNPGPIASNEPTMKQLIVLKKSDDSGEDLRIIDWIASLSRSKCTDFAHLLLDDSVKVRTHQKISNSDEFVRAVLEDWLSSGGDTGAVCRTWAALADCMEEAGLPGTLVKAVREICLSGSPSQTKNEGVDLLSAKASHFDSSEVDSMEQYCPIKVIVKPEIPEKLLTLMEKYNDMLVKLQMTKLSKPDLKQLRLFLSGYRDEISLESCSSPQELVTQLKAKSRIYIFNIDTLTSCCKYFGKCEVIRSVHQYKERLNAFLSTTSVKEFQSSLQTEVAGRDDMEKITLKLNETTSNDTLLNLKKLVYHFFGNISKALILYEIHRGCVCVSWIVPASLVSTLRAKALQLSIKFLASRGVLELVIGLRIVPNEGEISKTQLADAAPVFQYDNSTERLEEQQRTDKLIATILKRKESELEAEKNNKLWLEEKCEKQEMELKKATNEHFALEMELKAERKENLQFKDMCEEMVRKVRKLEKELEIQAVVPKTEILSTEMHPKVFHPRKDIEQPTLPTLLHHLEEVHSDWFVIGMALRVPHSKLREIEFLYSHSKCMNEMIQHWLASSSYPS